MTWYYITKREDLVRACALLQAYVKTDDCRLAVDVETYVPPEALALAQRIQEKKKPIPLPIWTGEYWLGRMRLVQVGTCPIHAPYEMRNIQFIFDCDALGDDVVSAGLKDILENAPVIGHNLKYDYGFLRTQLGITLNRDMIACTMLFNQLLKAGIKSLGHKLYECVIQHVEESILESLTGMTFEPFVKFKEAQQESNWAAPELSLEQLSYSAYDVTLTHYVHEKQLDQLNRWVDEKEQYFPPEKSLAARAANEFANIPTYSMMEIRGMPFNVDRHKNQVVPYLASKREEYKNNLTSFKEFQLTPEIDTQKIIFKPHYTKIDEVAGKAAELAAQIRTVLNKFFKDIKYVPPVPSEAELESLFDGFLKLTPNSYKGNPVELAEKKLAEHLADLQRPVFIWKQNSIDGDEVHIMWRCDTTPEIGRDEIFDLISHLIPSQFVRLDYEPINLNSPDQLKRSLLKRFGEAVESTEAKVLKKYKASDPDVVQSILNYKNAKDLLSKYGEGLVDKATPRGFINSSWNQMGTEESGMSTGRNSSSRPNCFPGEVEVLTNRGWVRFDELTKEEQLAQCDMSTREISFAHPLAWIEQEFVGDLTRFSTDSFLDMISTPDHEFIAQHRKRTGIWKKVTSDQLKVDMELPVAGHYCGGSNDLYSEAELIVVAAFQADGSIMRKYEDGSVRADFVFSKERKTKRLCAALQKIGLSFSQIKKKHNGELIDRVYVTLPEKLSVKVFDSSILDLDKKSFNFLAQEVWFWDGCYERESQYCSKHKVNSDWVQILQLLSGKRAKVREYHRTGDYSHKSFWLVDAVRVKKMDVGTSSSSKFKRESVPFDGLVYCATMPMGSLIVRHNGKALIVGNCQNIPARKPLFPVWVRIPGEIDPKALTKEFASRGLTITEKVRDEYFDETLQQTCVAWDIQYGVASNFLFRASFEAPPGYILVDADFSQIEPRLTAEITGDSRYIAALCNGEDLHALTAMAVLDLAEPPEKGTFERDYIGKTMNLAISYGIGPAALAIFMYQNTDGLVDWDKDDAKIAIEKYFKMYPGIKRAMDQVRSRIASAPAQYGSLAPFKGHKTFGEEITICGRVRHFCLPPSAEKMGDEYLSADYNPDNKRYVWNDYKQILNEAGLAGYNFLIQGAAASVFKIAVEMIDRDFDSMPWDHMTNGLIAVVHDEVMCLVQEEYAEQAAAIVKKRMMEAGEIFLKRVPCAVNMMTGSDWSKVH